MEIRALSCVIFLVQIWNTSGFHCFNCAGANCFENPRSSECFGSACSISRSDNLLVYLKKCGPIKTLGMYHQCIGNFCNEFLPTPQELEVSLVCYQCEQDKGSCITTRECGSPNVWAHMECYTIFQWETKSLKKGCIGDLSQEELRNFQPQLELWFEVCDSNLCNANNRFLNKNHLKHLFQMCKQCLARGVNCVDRICPNPEHKYYFYCYYSFTSDRLGCLSDWSVDNYILNRGFMQVCFGFMCNEGQSKDTATTCNRDFSVNPHLTNICFRRDDSCYSNTDISVGGCQTEMDSIKNWCLNGYYCMSCSGSNCRRRDISKNFLRCHVCWGLSCNVITQDSITNQVMCDYSQRYCLNDPEKSRRFCADEPGPDKTLVCSDNLCNTQPFGIYCYQCLSRDPNCAGHNFHKFRMVYCHNLFSCFTRSDYLGRTERGCGEGEPDSTVCEQQLCNKEPFRLGHCHRYSYALSVRTSDIKFQRLRQTYSWATSSCQRKADAPLCYMMIRNNTISGGCSSENLEISELFQFRKELKGFGLHFCDYNSCNRVHSKPGGV